MKHDPSLDRLAQMQDEGAKREAHRLAALGFLSPRESTLEKTRGRLGAFAVGVLVAWLGLPMAVHLAYWGGIVLAFGAGYFIGAH